MDKRFILLPSLSIGILLSLVGCGNLSNVSKEGTTDNPIFPKLEDATFHTSGTQVGSWPNWENIRQIERGMNKDQISYLIGRPHFSEGLYGVREWDYVFNYRENGEHRVCQFKVLFDKNLDAQSFYWYPNGCNGYARFTLNSDLLFDFDDDKLNSQGKEVIAKTIAQIRGINVESLKVAGYTDRLGSVDYNLGLSERRANSVKSALIDGGIEVEVQAIGYGKSDQVKECKDLQGVQLKDCLRPNRRVEIVATGSVQQQFSDVPGLKGPSLLYKK